MNLDEDSILSNFHLCFIGLFFPFRYFFFSLSFILLCFIYQRFLSFPFSTLSCVICFDSLLLLLSLSLLLFFYSFLFFTCSIIFFILLFLSFPFSPLCFFSSLSFLPYLSHLFLSLCLSFPHFHSIPLPPSVSLIFHNLFFLS